MGSTHSHTDTCGGRCEAVRPLHLYATSPPRGLLSPALAALSDALYTWSFKIAGRVAKSGRIERILNCHMHDLGLMVCHRVGNFRQKNYSAEDGVDGTISLFRRNSGYSAEQKTLGIPFRTVSQRRKCSEFCTMELSKFHSEPFRGRKNSSEFRPLNKIEANTWNSVPNHSAEEKSTRNSVPWNKNRSKLPFRSCLGGKHSVC